MAKFKVGDTVRVDASYSGNVNNGIGKVVEVDGSSDIVVEFAGHGTVRVPVPYATLANSRALNGEYKIKDVLDAMSDAKAYMKDGDVNPNMANVLETAIRVYERSADAMEKSRDARALDEAKKVLSQLKRLGKNASVCNSTNPIVRNAFRAAI